MSAHRRRRSRTTTTATRASSTSAADTTTTTEPPRRRRRTDSVPSSSSPQVRPAQPPVPETFSPQSLQRALYEPTDAPWTLVDAKGRQVAATSSLEDAPPSQLRLGRAENPQQVYAWLPTFQPLSLDHHRPDWGQVHYAVLYPRHPTRPNTFVAPPPKQAQLCAVKVLRKQVVEAYLREGGHENPLREMCRYEELGDNLHVLKPIELLHDDDHWFIVTPLGTPLDKIIYGKSLPLDKARAYFGKMLRILAYLREHGIHARDVKPQNFVLLPQTDTLVLMDLAMSCRMPRDKETGEPCRLQATGNFGTVAYMAPEVCYQRPSFDGVAADLWSVVLILYDSVMGQRLYRLPVAADAHYYLFCARGGFFLSSTVPEVATWIKKVDTNVQASMQQTLQRHERLLTDSLRTLFAHSLCHNPAQRWTLAQVMECDFVKQPQTPI